MTLRVYTVASDGHISKDTGTREYAGTEANADVSRNALTYPACTCFLCRRKTQQ